jgi:hypothetical protein
LCRNDKYTIWSEDQPFRDQINRHLCVARENLVKHDVYDSQVVNDNDRNAHIGRQVPRQPGPDVEATHANDGKVSCRYLRFSLCFYKESVTVARLSSSRSSLSMAPK